jgi:hypothetical protein
MIRGIARQGIARHAERNPERGKERQHRHPSLWSAQHRALRPASREGFNGSRSATLLSHCGGLKLPGFVLHATESTTHASVNQVPLQTTINLQWFTASISGWSCPAMKRGIQ